MKVRFTAILICLLAMMLLPACDKNKTNNSATEESSQTMNAGAATEEEAPAAAVRSDVPEVPEAAPEGIQMDSKDWVLANNQFAVDLFGLTAFEGDYKDKNMSISPYSIERAMGMVEIGAVGQTRSEIQKAMHIAEGTTNAAQAGKEIEDAIQSASDIEVTVANRLWTNTGFVDAYVANIKAAFGAEFEKANFAGDPEGERQKINQWVEDQTKSKITNLLPQNSITPLTKSVLVNAIYFKAMWMVKFDKEKTVKDAPFFAASGQTKVDMMRAEPQKVPYNLITNGENSAKAILLPYVNPDFAMMLVWTDPEEGAENHYVPLFNAYKALSAASVAHFMENIGGMTKVQLNMPKFKSESSFSLNDYLNKLGMDLPFRPEADFSGMTTEDKIYISGVYHKTFVEVEEEGTEAAAATAVVMTTRSLGPRPEPPEVVTLDHPFIYAIVHKSGTILFLGKYEKP